MPQAQVQPAVARAPMQSAACLRSPPPRGAAGAAAVAQPLGMPVAVAA